MRSSTRRQFLAGAAGVAVGALSRLASASDEPLRIGMSTALSGPASALGTAVKAGVEAYLALANTVEHGGGVAGRRLELVALDDAYEPARTAVNVHRLIEQEQVFAILGNVGTPTAAVTVPIAQAARVPFFGAFTGAGLLRKTPPDRYVINFRASYAQETAEMVRGLVKELGVEPSRLAFLTQDDAYGDSGFAGAVRALAAMGFDRAHRLPHGRYPRNTEDVEDALARVLDPRVSPRAVIMVGSYSPCAKFIRIARASGLDAIFANVSFVGTRALAEQLGSAGDGVVITQVVPHYDSPLAATRAYRAAIGATAPDVVSLEGFITAKAFVEGLRASGPELDRERFVDTLESGVALDLGLGMTHALSPDVHQLSDTVWPTYLRAGRLVAMRSWAELRRARART